MKLQIECTGKGHPLKEFNLGGERIKENDRGGEFNYDIL
jgi:hypothetical protein